MKNKLFSLLVLLVLLGAGATAAEAHPWYHHGYGYHYYGYHHRYFYGNRWYDYYDDCPGNGGFFLQIGV
jgi:hypothetical protein